MLPLIAAHLAAPDAAPGAPTGASTAPEGTVTAPADGRGDGRADEGGTHFGDVLRGEEHSTTTDAGGAGAPAAHSARGHARKAANASDSDAPATATVVPFYLLAHWLPALAASTSHPSTPRGESSAADGGDGPAPAGDIPSLVGNALPHGNGLPHGDVSPAGRRPIEHAAMAVMDDLSANLVEATAQAPASHAKGVSTGDAAPADGGDGKGTGDRLTPAGLAGVPATDDAAGRPHPARSGASASLASVHATDEAAGGSAAIEHQAASLLDVAHTDTSEPAMAASVPQRDAPARDRSTPASNQVSSVHVDASPAPTMPAMMIPPKGDKTEPSVAVNRQPASATQPAGDSPRSVAGGERRQPASPVNVPLPASSAGVPLPASSTELAADVSEQAPLVRRDGTRATGGAAGSPVRDAQHERGAALAAAVIGQARALPDPAPHTPAPDAVPADASASPTLAGGKGQSQAVRGDTTTGPASDAPSAQAARLAGTLPLVAVRQSEAQAAQQGTWQGEAQAASQPDTNTKRGAREKGDAKAEQAPSWRFQAWPLPSDGRNVPAPSRGASVSPNEQRHESRDTLGDTPAITPAPDTRHKDIGLMGAVAPQVGNLAAATVMQDVRITQADVRTGATAQAAPVTKTADKGGLAPERAVSRHETDEATDTAPDAAARHDQSSAFALLQTPTTASNGAVTGGAEHGPAAGHGTGQLPPSLAPVIEGIVVRQASLHQGAAGSSFNVVLQPEALGTVRIRVENGHDGLRVTLAPQQQEAHGLLAHHLDDLVATLQRGSADAARIHVDVLAPDGHIGADTTALAGTSAAHEAGHHANSGGYEGNQEYEGGQGQSQSQNLAGNMGSMDGGQRQGAYRDDTPAWTPMDARPIPASPYGWSASRVTASRDSTASRRAPHTARIDVQA